jgi:hypothetical protein
MRHLFCKIEVDVQDKQISTKSECDYYKIFTSKVAKCQNVKPGLPLVR